MRHRGWIGLGVVALLAAAPSWCSATILRYEANLVPLNNSGVTGTAFLSLDTDTDMLTVEIQARGLEPGMVHPQHIHGRLNDLGQPLDSEVPLPLARFDDDNDGFLEVAEGADAYGPIILPLTSPPGGALSDFPVAPDGTINFTQTYNLLTNSIYAPGFDKDDLLPLPLREIVLHGAFVPAGAGAGTGGEVDGGPSEYLAVLPVAAGEITAIPEPGSLALLGMSALGFAGYMRRSKKPTEAA